MNKTTRFKKGSGFTLIELVIVIVLLGILAATALPKFVDLTGQARTAANQGFGGGLSTSVSQVHGLWLAQGSPATVTLEDGTQVHLNSSGWPDGIGSAAEASNAGCANIWNSLLQNPTQAVAGATGCGTTSPCYNAVYAAGVCTYSVNNFSSITVTYTSTTGSVVAAP